MHDKKILYSLHYTSRLNRISSMLYIDAGVSLVTKFY